MKIETVRITSTTVHEMSVDGASDVITKDYTRKTFVPDRLTVTTVAGRVTRFTLAGTRRLAKGVSRDQVVEQFTRREYGQNRGRWESLAGVPAPAWAVEAAERLESDR